MCGSKSIQPTYEELKPAKRIFNLIVWSCIQPTYEELKPLMMWSLCPDTSVSSLPMRNWNKFNPRCISFQPIPVSSLPMRNWNYTHNSEYVNMLLGYPAYLWGIETHRNSINLDKRFTYPAYLWGIETLYHLYRPNQLARYPAYLWGIETWHSFLFLPGFTAYPAYLWGIETNNPAAIADMLHSVSSLPMRNWNLDRGVLGLRV